MVTYLSGHQGADPCGPTNCRPIFASARNEKSHLAQAQVVVYAVGADSVGSILKSDCI